MLPYIAAPWILWVMDSRWHFRCLKFMAWVCALINVHFRIYCNFNVISGFSEHLWQMVAFWCIFRQWPDHFYGNYTICVHCFGMSYSGHTRWCICIKHDESWVICFFVNDEALGLEPTSWGRMIHMYIYIIDYIYIILYYRISLVVSTNSPDSTCYGQWKIAAGTTFSRQAPGSRGRRPVQCSFPYEQCSKSLYHSTILVIFSGIIP